MKNTNHPKVEVDDQEIIHSSQFICRDGSSVTVRFTFDAIPMSVCFQFASDEAEKGPKIYQLDADDNGTLNVQLLNWGDAQLGIATPWKWPLAKVNGKQVSLAGWGNSVSDSLLIFVQFMVECDADE